VLQTGRIEFDDGKANIAADSYGVLDRAANAIARCADANFEIGAHSDSDGSTSRNRDRTQARAEAIADFLVGAGVKRERIATVGYGESAPIADNGTAEGKAANRRIEFVLAVPEGG
jgi:OOP family OmpA-OmpF porin